MNECERAQEKERERKFFFASISTLFANYSKELASNADHWNAFVRSAKADSLREAVRRAKRRA